jgi:predicted Zn-dependent peptidase
MVMAGACVPEPRRFKFHHAELRGRTGNGLRFVLMPDPTTQLVEVDVRYDVGAAEDPPGQAGMAHLAEHLMFQQRPAGPRSPSLIQIGRVAQREFEEAAAWYEQQEIGLGFELLEEVDRVVASPGM